MYPWISRTLDFGLQFSEKKCGLYMDVYGIYIYAIFLNPFNLICLYLFNSIAQYPFNIICIYSFNLIRKNIHLIRNRKNTCIHLIFNGDCVKPLDLKAKGLGKNHCNTIWQTRLEETCRRF